MKNNELLKSMPVSQPVSAESLLITTTKSNGKYKQRSEISTLNPELQAQFMDLVIEYMEESINWPDPDDQETFEKQLLG